MRTAQALAIDQVVDDLAEEIRGVRRHLHRHPEPSEQEYQTTAFLAGRLAAEGIPHRVAPGGRGIIAGPTTEGEGSGDGRGLVAIRADIDALRLQEGKLGVPYRSACDGVMHACGHDAHAAMALGAAIALHRGAPGSSWRVIFQPAEETATGALEMIRAGAMAGVSAILALHVDPELEVGRVAQRAGVLTADCRSVTAVVRGRGGHAARPHQANDPVAAAAMFVTGVYQAVPRAVDVREPLVVTFGSIHGGASFNVIPDQVELRGTIRSLGRSARERATGAIQAVGRGVAAATGVDIEISYTEVVPQVLNDPAVNAAMTRAASALLGPGAVDAIPQPSLGGEDFAFYLAHAPGAMLRLGVAAAPGWPPLHSPRFDIDERALTIGAKLLARAALLLSDGGPADA